MVRKLGMCRTVHLSCLLTLAASGACGDPVGNPPSAELELPPPLGPPAFSTEMDPFQPGLQWGADGRTIYAVHRLGLPHGVVALDIQSKQLRTIVDGAVQVLRISQDGAFLFYSTQRPGTPSDGAYSIVRLPTAGGDPEELVRGASHVFGISSDGSMLAWRSQTSDSTYVRDLASGETRHVASGFPLSISPDYSTLLDDTQGLSATDLRTGSRTTTSTTQARLLDARWGAAGAELLFWGLEGRLLVQRGIAGARGTLWQVGSGERFHHLQSATWSPDGTQVAAGIAPGCISAPCERQLVLIDVANGTSRVLVKDRGAMLGRAIFSPDGRNLAVTSGGHIHVVPIP